MKITFTTNGTHFETNETGTYFYATYWDPIEGKDIKKRIKKAEFEAAQRENEMEKAIAEAEESATTEEIEEIQKELAPKKARKPRKSKDIAYEGNGLTLTAKQVDFIRHLPDTYFWEHGLDSQIWCDILADEIKGQFAGKPMTTGAMLSTICEKGLGTRCKDHVNGRKCTSFALTELGKIVAKELGLC